MICMEDFSEFLSSLDKNKLFEDVARRVRDDTDAYSHFTPEQYRIISKAAADVAIPLMEAYLRNYHEWIQKRL